MGVLDAVQVWSYTRRLDKGLLALRRGDGRTAASAFYKLLRRERERLEFQEGLLYALLLQGKSGQVLEHYEQLSAPERKSLAALELMALAMQVRHLKPKGVKRWLNIPNTGPQRIVLLKELCESYAKCSVFVAAWAKEALQHMAFEEAASALRKLRDATPALPEYEIAQLYTMRDAMRFQQQPEALRALEEGLQRKDAEERAKELVVLARRHMDNAVLQHDAGFALLEAGEPKTAVRYLKRAVNISPYWVNAWIHLAQALLKAERYHRSRLAWTRVQMLQHLSWVDELMIELDEHLEQHPEQEKFEDALVRLGVGDLDGALVPLSAALEQSPKCWPLRRRLGETLFALGQYDRAIHYLMQAWEAEEEADFALTQMLEKCAHHYVLHLLREEELDDALTEAKALLLELGESGTLFRLLAHDQRLLAHVQGGALPLDALLRYMDTLPLVPIEPQVRLQRLSALLEHTPEFSQAWLAKAVWLEGQGALEQASEALEHAFDGEHDAAAIQFHQGGLAFLQQDIERAKGFWNLCVESGDEVWASLARQNLRALRGETLAELQIAVLPGYSRVLEFMPEQVELADKAQSAELFALPIQSDPAQETLLQQASEAMVASALPRLSDLAPTSSASESSVVATMPDQIAVPKPGPDVMIGKLVESEDFGLFAEAASADALFSTRVDELAVSEEEGASLGFPESSDASATSATATAAEIPSFPELGFSASQDKEKKEIPSLDEMSLSGEFMSPEAQKLQNTSVQTRPSLDVGGIPVIEELLVPSEDSLDAVSTPGPSAEEAALWGELTSKNNTDTTMTPAVTEASGFAPVPSSEFPFVLDVEPVTVSVTSVPSDLTSAQMASGTETAEKTNLDVLAIADVAAESSALPQNMVESIGSKVLAAPGLVDVIEAMPKEPAIPFSAESDMASQADSESKASFGALMESRLQPSENRNLAEKPPLTDANTGQRLAAEQVLFKDESDLMSFLDDAIAGLDDLEKKE